MVMENMVLADCIIATRKLFLILDVHFITKGWQKKTIQGKKIKKETGFRAQTWSLESSSSTAAFAGYCLMLDQVFRLRTITVMCEAYLRASWIPELVYGCCFFPKVFHWFLINHWYHWYLNHECLLTHIGCQLTLSQSAFWYLSVTFNVAEL